MTHIRRLVMMVLVMKVAPDPVLQEQILAVEHIELIEAVVALGRVGNYPSSVKRFVCSLGRLRADMLRAYTQKCVRVRVLHVCRHAYVFKNT